MQERSPYNNVYNEWNNNIIINIYITKPFYYKILWSILLRSFLIPLQITRKEISQSNFSNNKNTSSRNNSETDSIYFKYDEGVVEYMLSSYRTKFCMKMHKQHNEPNNQLRNKLRTKIRNKSRTNLRITKKKSETDSI